MTEPDTARTAEWRCTAANPTNPDNRCWLPMDHTGHDASNNWDLHQDSDGNQWPQPLDLDAIEQRANAATEGPWWNDAHEIYAGEHDIPAMSTWIAESCNIDLPDKGSANGTFLAHARQDVPAMVAEIRRLRAELAGMTDFRDRAIAKQDTLRAELAERTQFAVDISVDRERAKGHMAEALRILDDGPQWVNDRVMQHWSVPATRAADVLRAAVAELDAARAVLDGDDQLLLCDDCVCADCGGTFGQHTTGDECSCGCEPACYRFVRDSKLDLIAEAAEPMTSSPLAEAVAHAVWHALTPAVSPSA